MFCGHSKHSDHYCAHCVPSKSLDRTTRAKTFRTEALPTSISSTIAQRPVMFSTKSSSGLPTAGYHSCLLSLTDWDSLVPAAGPTSPQFPLHGPLLRMFRKFLLPERHATYLNQWTFHGLLPERLKTFLLLLYGRIRPKWHSKDGYASHTSFSN
jgi:hypothetical protein